MPVYRIETDRGIFDVETEGEADEAALSAQLEEQLAPEEPGFLRKAGALGLRVGGPIIGGALGAAGGPVGIAAGAAAGGVAGEAAARSLLGEEQTVAGLAAAGVTGAIPAGPFAKLGAKAVTTGAKVALGAAEGATQGLLGTTVQTGIEQGRLPTLGEAAVATAGGSVLGGALGPLTKGANTPAAQPEDLSDVTDDITKAFAATAPKEKVPGSAFTKSGPEPETPVNPARPGRIAEHEAIVDRDLAGQPEEVREVIKKVYANNPELVPGEVPFARTEEEAARLQFDPADVAPGFNPNDAEGLAMRNLATRLAIKTTELNAAGAPAEDLVRAHEDFVDSVLVSRRGGAEQARALNARKIKPTGAAQPGADLDPAARAIRFVETANEYGASKEDIAAAYRRAGDDPTRQMRELMNIARPDKAQTARSLYITNLLTGPKTIERNLVGDALRLVEDIALKPVAAGVDAVSSIVTGRARQTFAGESVVGLLAAKKSLPAAGRAFFQVMKQGFTDADARRLSVGDGSKFDIPQEFGSTLLKPLNAVGRLLNGTDIFFRTLGSSVARDAGAYSRALRKARGEGLRGDQLKGRVADLMAEIAASPPKDLLEEVEEAGARSVFREGNLQAQKFDAWIDSLSLPSRAAWRITMPFIRTPANIIQQGFQHTPTGFVSKKGREAGRLGDMEKAKAALGTLLLYPLVDMAANGNLSGSASHTDAGKRDAFLAEHPENSIRFGDTWYQYTDLGPLAIPMILVSNAVQTWKEAGTEPKDTDVMELTKKVGQSMLAAGSSIFDASYLSGVGEALDAVQNPKQNLDKFLQRRLASLVPGQALLRAGAQAEDPTVRAPKGYAEQVYANTPGLQKKVPAKLDAFGDVIERGDKGARSLLIPTTKPAMEDPMREELNRLKVEVEPTKTVGEIKVGKNKVAIGRDGDFAVRQAIGMTKRFYVQRAMESPLYAKSDDAKREDLIRRNLKQAGTFVKERAAFVLRKGQPLTTEALLPREALEQ